MQRTYCVYNKTRESFLCLGVVAADTHFARLKGLIGRLTLRLDEGLWVVPSSGVHTLGVLFPIDLVYLDEMHRVVHLIEHFPTFRVAPFKPQAASVLQLPTHTIYPSQTQVGDQLLICPAEEMEFRLRRSSTDPQEAKPKDNPEGKSPELTGEKTYSFQSIPRKPALDRPGGGPPSGQSHPIQTVRRKTVPDEAASELASTPPDMPPESRRKFVPDEPGKSSPGERLAGAMENEPSAAQGIKLTVVAPDESSGFSAYEAGTVEKEKRKKPGIEGRKGRSKMNPILTWLATLLKEDARGSLRRDTSRIVAYYWDGDAPEPHPIRNVSVSGLFLVTEQRWRPGTIVTMTMQKAGPVADDPLRSIAIQAKVVRLAEDGVGMKFVFPQNSDPRAEYAPMGNTADKRALVTFLQSVPEP
jgi:uncharacterized membrane protein (UPF0127 family)